MKFCPYCGKELTIQSSFCPYCGKALSADAPAPTAEVKPANKAPKTTKAVKAKLPRKKIELPKKRLLPIAALCIAIALIVVLLVNPFQGNFADDPDAIQKAANSVVKLYMYDYNNNLTGTGSGFAALDSDIIITNHHCINGNVYSIQAERADHSFFPIESVVAYDEEKDIAILRAPESKLSPLATGNSKNINRGEKTVAIGSPIGLQQMVSTGVFSNYLNFENYSIILSTASISHGSSGGALFNNHGKVIGITSGAYESGNDLYFSIPMHYVQELYDARKPETEMTLIAFYEQSEHPYSVNDFLVFADKLHTKTVTIQGYVGCNNAFSICYLVETPEQVVPGLDFRGTTEYNSQKSAQMDAFVNSETYVMVNVNPMSLMDGIYPGDFIEATGTAVYSTPNNVYVYANTIKKLS